MKKFYAFVLTLIGVFSLFSIQGKAQTATITLVIDDASRVSLSTTYGPYNNLVTGENVLTYSSLEGEHFDIGVKSASYGLTSVTWTTAGGQEQDVDIEQNWDGTDVARVTPPLYQENGGRVVVTSYAKELPSFTISIDDPDAVTVRHNDFRMTLSQGDNIVQMHTENDWVEIKGEHQLYQVLHNDQEIESLMNGTSTDYPVINVKGNDRIEIKANYPADAKTMVKILPGSDEAKGFITSVIVNDQPIPEEQWETGFEVALGTYVEYTGNTKDYQFEKIVLNGKDDTSFAGSSSFFVGSTDEYTLTYFAAPYPTYQFTINVDHAENIEVYRMYKELIAPRFNQTVSQENIIALQDGQNMITLPENVTEIGFRPADGCQIVSFKDENGVDVKDAGKVAVMAGKMFTVITQKGTSTHLDETKEQTPVTKVIGKDGVIYILRNGQVYTLTGTIVQ